jgi:2-polyprenyl-3-methyl-5-hydroxy-6-metoxy-1,4-benzoquinol methylase
MEEKILCDVCEGIEWEKYTEKLIRCLGCGLIRAKINPTPAELEKAYEHDYFFGGEYIDYIRDRVALEKNFQSRLEDLVRYVPASGSIIEVGCSYGFFLNLCKDKFAHCIGYDITKEGIDYATKTLGLTAYCDSFLNYNGGMVDAVCLWDVMEHLPNPGAVIAKISTVVKVGGYVSFSTGDAGSLVARLRGDKWRLVHPPTHLFYFDKKSITKLLAKNGFKIVSYTHKTVYRNVDSIFLQLMRGKPGSQFIKVLYNIAKKVKLTNISIGLNLFDIMDVIAVKS